MSLPGNYQNKKIFLKGLYFTGIIIIIFIIYSSLNFDKNMAYESINNIKHDNHVHAHQSTLFGLTKDLAPYKISADKISALSNKFDMEQVNASYDMGEQKLIFNAKTGLFDNFNKLVSLKGSVRIYLEELIIFSNRINLDLLNKQMSSDDRVDISYKNSQVKADKLISRDNVLELKGNVLTHINMLDF